MLVCVKSDVSIFEARFINSHRDSKDITDLNTESSEKLPGQVHSHSPISLIVSAPQGQAAARRAASRRHPRKHHRVAGRGGRVAGRSGRFSTDLSRKGEKGEERGEGGGAKTAALPIFVRGVFAGRA